MMKTWIWSADPVLDRILHVYPTNKITLVQINHHVEVKRAGQVLVVQVPDRVSHPRGTGKLDAGNRSSGQARIVNAADRQRELEDQPSDDRRRALVTVSHAMGLHCVPPASAPQDIILSKPCGI